MGVELLLSSTIPKLKGSQRGRGSQLFAVSSWSLSLIEGHWIPYSREHPLVLAVSGAVVAEGRALAGKRAAVSTFSGFWELAPSGAVSENLNPQEEFQRELREETGFNEKGQFFGIVQDQEAKVLDLLFKVELSKMRIPHPNEEYSEFKWLTQEELKQLELLPTSKSILNYLHLI